MDYITIISNILKIIVFVVVAGAAIYVAYMSHKKNQIKEHFEDLSGIEVAFDIVLQRKPNSNETAYFSELAISNGYTKQEFEIVLVKLVENIKKAYNELLSRDPSQEEIDETIVLFTTYNYKYEDILRYVEIRSANKKPAEGDKVNQQENRDVENRVTFIFQSLLLRSPSPEEVIKYVQLDKTKEILIDSLEDHIRASQEYKELQVEKQNKEIQKGKDDFDSKNESNATTMSKISKDMYKDKYDINLQIISLFQGILERNPTEEELDYYYNKMYNKQMTLKDIRIEITQKDEYTSTSDNNIKALQNEVSKTQATYLVTTEFQSIYNRDPTSVEVKTLIDKMNSNNMTVKELRDYIINQKKAENYTGPGSTAKNEEMLKLSEQTTTVPEIIDASNKYIDHVKERNDDNIKMMIDHYQTGYNKETDYMNIDLVAEEKKNECKPCIQCRVISMNDQTALIGTLLNDANNTQVGSILPMYINGPISTR